MWRAHLKATPNLVFFKQMLTYKFIAFFGGFLNEERPRANEKQKSLLGKKKPCRKLFYKTPEGKKTLTVFS
jgi:hypothetical protein